MGRGKTAPGVWGNRGPGRPRPSGSQEERSAVGQRARPRTPAPPAALRPRRISSGVHSASPAAAKAPPSQRRMHQPALRRTSRFAHGAGDFLAPAAVGNQNRGRVARRWWISAGGCAGRPALRPPSGKPGPRHRRRSAPWRSGTGRIAAGLASPQCGQRPALGAIFLRQRGHFIRPLLSERAWPWPRLRLPHPPHYPAQPG